MSLKSYSPSELYEKFRDTRNSVSPKEFFSSPEHKKTQEVWCIAQFSRAFLSNLGACSVLVADHDEQTDTDFYLEVRGIPYPFQITEVQTAGRRRGDEYKNRELMSSTLQSWDSGTEQGALWIRESIQKKYDRYGRNVSALNLLIYVNFPAYEHDYDEICGVTGDLAKKFASVWLLSGNGACCVSGSKALGGPHPWLFIPQGDAIDE